MSNWRKIREGYNKFADCLNWKLGSGDSIGFWDDTWLGDAKLKDCFPSIFAIARFKEAYMNEMFLRSCEGGEWCVRVGRILQDWEVENYCKLLNLLAGFSLRNRKDERIWKLSKDEIFSVNSYYKHLIGQGAGNVGRFPHKQI